MNTKSFGINAGLAGLSLVFSLAGVGCSGGEGEGSVVEGESGAEQAPQVQQDGSVTPAEVADAAPAESKVIHATIALGEDHVVQFVEYFPGAFGLIEIGRTLIDVPRITSEVEQLSWSDQYRHFAGASAPLPQAMELALERAALAPRDRFSGVPAQQMPLELLPPTTPAVQGESAPHFYTVGEQNWFNQTFCNGAEICAQGVRTVHMQTPRKISKYTVFAMVGAEGTANGRLDTYFWKCGGIWPFNDCFWLEIASTVIVPGHFIVSTLSPSSNSWFFLWDVGMTSGVNTLVSGSADF